MLGRLARKPHRSSEYTRVMMTCERYGRITDALDFIRLMCWRPAIRASRQTCTMLRLQRPRKELGVPQGCAEIVVRIIVHHPASARSEFGFISIRSPWHNLIRARIHWSDPMSRECRSRSASVGKDIAAQDFLELRRRLHPPADPLIAMYDHPRSIGDSLLRDIDPKSTAGRT